MVITGEANIRWVRMRSQLATLKLEMAGLKKGGGSMLSQIKREYGLKGLRAAVYNQFMQLVEDNRPS